MRSFIVCLYAGASLGFLALPLHASTLANGGFETPESVESSLPNTFGDWAGDGGTIVTSENGITPGEGIQMMRFEYTFLGTAGSASWSDQYQLIDMSSLGTEIAAGMVTVSASGQFNRIVQDSQTDSEFRISLQAFDGLPSAFDDAPYSGIPSLAGDFSDFLSDANTSTWEEATISLSLPTDTTYVALCISAVENVWNDSEYPELDAHYADDIQFSVSIIPEPTTFTLLGLGSLALVMVRRSR